MLAPPHATRAYTHTCTEGYERLRDTLFLTEGKGDGDMNAKVQISRDGTEDLDDHPGSQEDEAPKHKKTIISEKIRSVGRRPFPKAKFDHIDFNVVFQKKLERRHLNRDPFL